MDNTKGYQIFRNFTDDPDSQRAQDLIKKMLGEGLVMSFPLTISAGIERNADYHSVDCMVYIMQGKLNIGFGEGYQDQAEAVRGDFLYIRRREPHLEKAVGAEDVKVIIYYIGDFQAFSV